MPEWFPPEHTTMANMTHRTNAGALALWGWRKRAPTKCPSKNSRLWWDRVFVFHRCRLHWKLHRDVLHRDVLETGWIFLWFFILLPVKLWERVGKANEKAYWPTSLCMIVGWRNLRCSATVEIHWEQSHPSGQTSFILSRVQCSPEKTALKFHRQACGQDFSK